MYSPVFGLPFFMQKIDQIRRSFYLCPNFSESILTLIGSFIKGICIHLRNGFVITYKKRILQLEKQHSRTYLAYLFKAELFTLL
jgi:hypothetical protein